VFGTLAWWLRVTLGYPAALGQDVVTFIDSDAWYHMRLVDNLIHNFPRRIWFDPYLLHPGGQVTQVAPLLDWLIAGTALTLGSGQPSPHLVDLVGVYMPPVIGALTVVPVYFLGRELFSRRAGLCAAAIIGVLPGEVLLRSLLGFTDHHCLETLLSSTVLMWLVFALDPASPWRRRMLFAACGGISLGAYLLTWSGGAFLVGILSGWALLHIVVERLRGSDAIEAIGMVLVSFAIAALMILPWVETTRSFANQATALTAGFVGLPIVWALGRLTRTRAAYVTLLIVAAVVGVVAVMLLSRAGISTVFGELQEMSPTRGQTVVEATPLFKSPDRFPLWKQFAASFYIAAVAVAMMLPDMLRARTAKQTLLLVWTVITAAATIGQLRFSYYLAVNVALLAGAGCDLLLRRITGSSPRVALRTTLVAALLGLLIVGPAVPLYGQFREQIPLPPEQIEAFDWMRENTPDPFDDPDAYDRIYSRRTADPSAEASYGVLASWARGYPMIRLARRVPNANGSQAGASELAGFLLQDDEHAAAEILTRLNTRYVMTEAVMVDRLSGAVPAPSEFSSMAVAADLRPEAYRDVFYRRDDTGRLQPVMLFYPSYYRSMAVRLQTFGGAEVTPVDSTWVISFAEEQRGGRTIKEIQTEQRFTHYEDAVAFINAAQSERYRIVGRDPSVSCVPLSKLQDYAPVYRSLARVATGSHTDAPSVRIFEYRLWNPRPLSD
jgi:dolichyl-diphosphooligosaccharide--protein glycosyltransferase